MLVTKVYANFVSSVFFNALVKMPACVTYITCITQVALKFINDSLPVDNW